MDKIYINLLVNQALAAYRQGGQDGLDQWKSKLPPPHLAAFDEHCAGLLNKAIAALHPELVEGLPKIEPVETPDTEAEPKEDAPAEPQKKRDNDPRRTRPI